MQTLCITPEWQAAIDAEFKRRVWPDGIGGKTYRKQQANLWHGRKHGNLMRDFESHGLLWIHTHPKFRDPEPIETIIRSVAEKHLGPFPKPK